MQAALDKAFNTHSVADVRALIEAGSCALWTEGSTAVVVEVYTFPTGEWLHIWLCGGDLVDAMTCLGRIEEYGRRCGYRGVSMNGREGWRELFKKRGYSVGCHAIKELHP